MMLFPDFFTQEERNHTENTAKSLQVVCDIHPQDFIFHYVYNHPCFKNKIQAINYYFSDGRNSAKKLCELLFTYLGLKPDISFLEFASGYGCLTRHLNQFMAEAKIVSCDIHDEAVMFIDQRIRSKAVLSIHTPEELNVGVYDVVFALSFFSHMPKESWSRWFASLLEKTNHEGYLIFTTHGEISNRLYIGGNFDNEGFYFRQNSEQMDLESSVYGTTATTFDFVNRIVSLNNCRLKMFAEGYWWGHQDLYIVQKV